MTTPPNEHRVRIKPAGPGVIVPHEETGGVVSFVEQTLDPRRLISGHVHEWTDVWIYVLKGRVGVRVGDREAIGEPGDYLLKPRGIPHAMWNPDDEPNRLIEILTPGNGDLFLREAAAFPTDADRRDFDAMAAKHGVRFFDEWTPDLRRRYGLA